METIHEYYQRLPLMIDPTIFSVGPFFINWYSLMYLASFAVTYFLLIHRFKKDSERGKRSWNFYSGKTDYSRDEWKDDLKNLLTAAFLGAIIGGRLGYIILYNFDYYADNWIEAFSPYNFSAGTWTGIYGMSYHGGFLGSVLFAWIVARKKGLLFLNWVNFAVPAIPAGYFLGRIGNFLNGELYGRMTDSFWGMYFWGENGLILRYPSQLIEAFFEGILLFILLWLIRNHQKWKNYLAALYLVGYGIARFMGEFFREPDQQLGYYWRFMTLGQILSIGMVIAGIFLYYLLKNVIMKK